MTDAAILDSYLDLIRAQGARIVGKGLTGAPRGGGGPGIDETHGFLSRSRPDG